MLTDGGFRFTLSVHTPEDTSPQIRDGHVDVCVEPLGLVSRSMTCVYPQTLVTSDIFQ